MPLSQQNHHDINNYEVNKKSIIRLMKTHFKDLGALDLSDSSGPMVL